MGEPPSYPAKSGQKNLLLKVLNFNGKDKGALNDIIDEGMIHEHKVIDRFGTMILVFAAVAPLMGLLGTVTGMISTFDIITEHGTGDPKLLSHGISEALITTELGLLVAIPALLFGNILSGWGKDLKMTLDKVILKVVNHK
jgi:biopolymer transport protein ExbB